MSSKFKKQIKDFIKLNLRVEIEDTIFFERSLTHKSYYQNFKGPHKPDYESLEFLGDSIVNFVISDLLFSAENTASNMTKLRSQIIQSKSMVFTTKKINLDRLIRFGPSFKGELPDSVLEDVFEAFCAAISLTLGFKKAKEFIIETLWENFLNGEFDFVIDYKTILQELAYKMFKAVVNYSHTTRTVGNNTLYIATCKVLDKYEAQAEDKKLKDAENQSAKTITLQLLDKKSLKFK